MQALPLLVYILADCCGHYRRWAGHSADIVTAIMGNDEQITVFHNPMSRSTRVVWLCEELGLKYDLDVVKVRGQCSDAFHDGQTEAKHSLQCRS